MTNKNYETFCLTKTKDEQKHTETHADVLFAEYCTIKLVHTYVLDWHSSNKYGQNWSFLRIVYKEIY